MLAPSSPRWVLRHKHCSRPPLAARGPWPVGADGCLPSQAAGPGLPRHRRDGRGDQAQVLHLRRQLLRLRLGDLPRGRPRAAGAPLPRRPRRRRPSRGAERPPLGRGGERRCVARAAGCVARAAGCGARRDRGRRLARRRSASCPREPPAASGGRGARKGVHAPCRAACRACAGPPSPCL
eukprot:1180277-Prorocentrum_minimum.AAC.3